MSPHGCASEACTKQGQAACIWPVVCCSQNVAPLQGVLRSSPGGDAGGLFFASLVFGSGAVDALSAALQVVASSFLTGTHPLTCAMFSQQLDMQLA